jgi:hypothetical protein
MPRLRCANARRTLNTENNMQPPPSKTLFRFLNTLLGPTLLGLSATAAASSTATFVPLADESQAHAFQGDSYLSRELVAAVQSIELPRETRSIELRGLEPIGTPDSLFLTDEQSDGEYLAALTEVQVHHRTFITALNPAF